VINPATGQPLDPDFAEAGAGEVNAAMEAADGAFEESLNLPPNWPADLLDAIATKIMDVGDALLERVDRRVLEELLVADLRLGHRPAHRRGRPGDGVAVQVDVDRGRQCMAS